MSGSRWQGIAAALLLVCAGACVIFAKDLFSGSDLFFKAVRDPNPFAAAYAWYQFHHEALLQGRFPLWNPWNGMGAPLIANYQSGFFSPFLWPLFVLPLSLVAVPYLLLRLVIAGAGTALYLRRLGLGSHSCTLGAVAFGLSGWMIQYVNNQHLVIDMLIPFILLFIERLRDEKRLRDVLAMIALLALVLLGGQPGSALFTLMFVGAYALVAAWRSGKSIMVFAAAGFAAALISLVQLIPFFELLAHGWSAHLPEWGTQHLRLSEIITIIAPGFYGYTSDSRIPIMQQVPYMGVIPVLLCLSAFFNFRNIPRAGGFFIMSILVCMGFLLGLPVFYQVISLPGLRQLSFLKYLQPLLTFSVAVCAALAMERAQAINRAVVVIICFIILFLLWQGNRFPEAWFFPVISAGLVVAQAALFAAFFKRRWIVVFLALLGLIIDSRFNRPNFFFNPEKHDYSFLKPFASRPPGFYRVSATPEVFSPNDGIMAGVSDLRLCEVLFVERHIEYLLDINIQNEDELRRHILPYNFTRIIPERKYFKSEPAEKAGLRWFLSKYPLPPNQTIHEILQGKIVAPSADHVSPSGFTINEDSRRVLYQHPPCLISISCERESFSEGLTGALALDPKVWELPGDGAWFICLNNNRVSYSRYIDPKNRADERGWVPMEMHNLQAGDLRFSTLPGNNIFNDWAGWGDIRRSNAPALEARMHKGFRVYENDEAYPRAFFAECASEIIYLDKGIPELFLEEKEICIDHGWSNEPYPESIMQENESNIRKEKNSKQDMFIVSPWPKSYASGTIQWRSMGLDSLELEFESKGDAALIITNTYYPGWRAWVDDKEAEIIPADRALQAVMVPKGKHELEMIYQPWSFRLGLWTSIVSLILWLGALILPSPRSSREA